MISGVKFGKYHSFYDLGLILSSVKIPPATPKTTYIDIPGADGQLDLTEALGSVKYQMREAEFTFSTMPDKNVEETKRLVSNALNGIDCNIIVEKDPEYYWQGRLTVSAYGYDYPVDTITIKATLKPYKLKHNLTVVGYIRNISNVTANPTVVYCKNECMPTIPTITTGYVDVYVKFNDGAFVKMPRQSTTTSNSLILQKGLNKVELYTLADTQPRTALFKYQEGSL